MRHEKRKYEQIGVAMTCRSYEEYVRMFALREEMLGSGPILDVSAGASSFVAYACGRGKQAVAADPLYRMAVEEIREHGRQEIETSTAKLAGLEDRFDWTFYGSLDQHQAMRERSLQRFVTDYELDTDHQRYIAAGLPSLPFESNTFELVMCSHFLFLYHEQFDYSFHRDAVKELFRVCRPGGEVRIYPIYTLGWERYPHLDLILEELRVEGAEASVLRSGLPFIPGSTELLCLKKQGLNGDIKRFLS
ncbi:class I SAM-dependent methyltransferase [Paenibacillus cremeus]|uniref:Methyltransferase domain-containing protein n=1 Tax=Paenibacillus cremeus TaxID=2163881 RepID=A0A559K3F0_9BACL|nr:methyltransferase domain-containing protein [Paenibacillus cremeus]TVY06658.1 methyltransferase domain-containing protein [Paenibacillus cremeus]